MKVIVKKIHVSCKKNLTFVLREKCFGLGINSRLLHKVKWLAPIGVIKRYYQPKYNPVEIYDAADIIMLSRFF